MLASHPAAADVANTLLAELIWAAPGGVLSGLEVCTLETSALLIVPGSRPEHVVFPEAGYVSLMAGDATRRVEVAMLGRRDLVGVDLALTDEVASYAAIVRVGGPAYCLPLDEIRRLLLECPAVAEVLHRHLRQQLEGSLWAHGASMVRSLERRLAAWLVEASGLLDSAILPATHDHIAQMLGFRRASVTVALHVLEGDGLIRSTRGRVEIRDRDRVACLAAGTR
ncbi:Crp/Fnr family transcriptional regulator [Methylobacterium segetis]|uniref:Crp/Fnr family transcriptional regulator n=1 Tax=Methylobacterium segetis TaxID=2488750 RepID=UPI00104836F7|nr:Crp/Fnr family transcriptional regulator [Methylobacterium segetis]